MRSMTLRRMIILVLLAITLGSTFLITWPSRAAERKGRLYAFLVACQKYDNTELKPLNFTKNDIVEFNQVLLDAGFSKDNIVLMHDGQPNKLQPDVGKIKKKLINLLAELQDNDTLIVALSGHGVQFKKKGQGKGSVHYFCPLDAELKNRDSLIALDWVYMQMKRCKARQKLLLVDACRDDPIPDGAKLPEVSLENLTGRANLPAPKGIVALFSCSAGQQSFEDPKLAHGVFFHHVLKGWRGEAIDRDGKVTLDSLAGYVKEKTPNYVRVILQKNVSQVPEQKGESSGSWVLPRPKYPKEITNSIGMKLVLIPAGKFTMGSPQGEKEQGEDEKEHEVEITRPFYMGVYEVTQAEFQAVMDSKPSFFSKTGEGKDKVNGLNTDRFPVEDVSWEDAEKFCSKLSARAKETQAKRVYRLPTEAEWEYACRGGARPRTTFHFGNSLSPEQANFDGDFPYGGAAKGRNLERTAKVGSYKPNAMGLYDMHGNVSEWCADRYDKDYYSTSPKKDPRGAETGTFRVLRGGSWHAEGRYCRSAARYSLDRPLPTIGFRVVISAGAKPD